MDTSIEELSGDLFNAVSWAGVAKGTCVVLEEHPEGAAYIVYAGPINLCPPVADKFLLLHADDFDKLREHVNKRKN